MPKPGGRKSKAEREMESVGFKLIDGGFQERAPPPDGLTERQQEIWREIVNSEPVDFFNTAALRALLKTLVCQLSSIEKLTKTMDFFQDDWLKNAEGVRRYGDLLKLRAKESSSASNNAVKLRLTNQSRYTPQAAATASRNMSKVRPWEEQ